MKTLIALLGITAVLSCSRGAPADHEAAEWARRAQGVTIVRDDHGIAHVHGHTDADAVFGMIYAQAEDDFNRIEMNYLHSMGRLAEAEGDAAVYSDLRMRLFITPDSVKAQYAASPQWLKQLMNAWADGLNFYLAKHPEVKPRVLTHFEPWMALTFSEGSIGGDIESISTGDLAAFYGQEPRLVVSAPAPRPTATGSNGFAIAPSNTASHHALLLINPHTSFFFRSELQVTSDEGLDAYGAVTWGQFFIYQGFNAHLGWMHTSSNVDNIDEYAETVVKGDSGYAYRYAGAFRPVVATPVTISVKGDGKLTQRTFTVFRTHHGPVVREANGKWISVRLMQDPVRALIESFTRTKANDYRAFKETVALRTNSSNNTIYADDKGNIAYFQASFIPKRDTRFDWTKPVDGSDSAVEWGPPLSLDEMPTLFDPPNGWLFNTNNAPWTAAGANSPKAKDFASYVDGGGENYRGIHAISVLGARQDFTIPTLIAAAFDSHLPAFADLLPPLLRDYDRTPASDPLKRKLPAPVQLLREWDARWSASSVATSVAVFWGEALRRRVSDEAAKANMTVESYMKSRASARERLESLAAATDSLTADFGKWQVPWGDVNRFQRLTGDIVQPFSDQGASIPVPFTSADWGSLAAFETRQPPGLKHRYGTNGNSFVAAVEFGENVHAMAVTAGGESGHPDSPHFNDQAVRYAAGDLREVYFYPAQLNGHSERTYHPGE